jgi:hypothetical protein
MVTIFTTSNNLADICYDREKQVWQDMILKLGEVFVSGNVDIPLDMEDPLFILDEAIKIDYSKGDYIDSITSDHEKVLEKPCGIFLLDIPTSDANDIQLKYGVVCQSISSMNHDVLTHKGFSAETEENEVGKNWNDIFRKFRDTPSNSAIIIDAHLFENDAYDMTAGCYDTKKNAGIKNLEQILNCLLPKSFDSVYHIAVLLTNIDEAKQMSRSRTSLTNARVASAINKLKKSLGRQYEICIEVHFFSQGGGFHQLIHNRRILSNYYVVDAPYKLAAFNTDGTARASQTITIKPLFELIHIDPESDMKEKRLRSDLKELGEYVKSQRKSPTSELYQNGKKYDTFQIVKHRLLI